MPRFDPDIARKLQGHTDSGMMMFGQSVTLRKYISASAGNPDVGIADKLFYQSRQANMEFRTLSIEENQMIGGQDIRGAYEVISMTPIDLRDEVVYNGETYRFFSQPEIDTVGVPIYYRAYAQRASITANY